MKATKREKQNETHTLHKNNSERINDAKQMRFAFHLANTIGAIDLWFHFMVRNLNAIGLCWLFFGRTRIMFKC